MNYTHMTKKQANVLYRAAKTGEIVIPKDLMSFAYHRAEKMYSYDANEDDVETRLHWAIDAIFEGDLDKAQESVNGAWTLYAAIFGLPMVPAEEATA